MASGEHAEVSLCLPGRGFTDSAISQPAFVLSSLGGKSPLDSPAIGHLLLREPRGETSDRIFSVRQQAAVRARLNEGTEGCNLLEHAQSPIK